MHRGATRNGYWHRIPRRRFSRGLHQARVWASEASTLWKRVGLLVGAILAVPWPSRPLEALDFVAGAVQMIR